MLCYWKLQQNNRSGYMKYTVYTTYNYIISDTSMQENGGNTDSQTTRLQLNSTTEASMTQVRGISVGLVAAIVIIILVIAVAGVAGVLIIAFVLRKFKTSRKTIAISQDQTVPQSFGKIDNNVLR